MERTISARLPADTMYVSGTVNGAVTVWTLKEDDGETSLWEAVADRAEDDVYYIEITVINAAGTKTETSLTLYWGLHLVTDRTEEDVRKVKRLAEKGIENWTAAEKAQWGSGLKGAYNAVDLNRVGGAVLYLSQRLQSEYEDLADYRETRHVARDPLLDFPYFPKDVQVDPKTDFQMEDVPTPNQRDRYLQDVQTLRDALASILPENTPALPESLVKLDWNGANAIERVLELVDSTLTWEAVRLRRWVENTEKGFLQAGEVYCGEA